jgi:hypothetical protein
MTINTINTINNMINEALDNMYTSNGSKPVVLAESKKHPVIRKYELLAAQAVENMFIKRFGSINIPEGNTVRG